MSREVGIQRSFWLTMLREGGRWRPKELLEALPPSAPLPTQSVGSVLQSMVRCGQVRAFPMAGRMSAFQYGVTAGCRLPMGVTIADLLAVGVVKVEPEPAPIEGVAA